MTTTVFDIRNAPEHKKPTFTDVAIKIGLLRVRILRLRSNLRSFDKALDDMHNCLLELEDVTNSWQCNKASYVGEVKYD